MKNMINKHDNIYKYDLNIFDIFTQSHNFGFYLPILAVKF